MARLVTILTGKEDGSHILRIILDHYDLHNFGGMFTREAADRMARVAIANQKTQFSWKGAIGYYVFYKEWTDERNAVHREAELEVTVL